MSLSYAVLLLIYIYPRPADMQSKLIEISYERKYKCETYEKKRDPKLDRVVEDTWAEGTLIFFFLILNTMTDKGSYRTHNVTGCTEPAEVERASSDQNCYRIGEIDKLSS